MIEIEKGSMNKFRVIFSKTNPSGRISTNYISAIPPNIEYDEPAAINIPATGDMQMQDIDEFIKAVRLAAAIADGQLKIS